MVYQYNYKNVSEEQFYEKLKECAGEDVAKFEQQLEENGRCCVIKALGFYRNSYDVFTKAPQVVLDMEKIIAENECDSLYNDAFSCAWALYKNGYGKRIEPTDGAVVLTKEEMEFYEEMNKDRVKFLLENNDLLLQLRDAREDVASTIYKKCQEIFGSEFDKTALGKYIIANFLSKENYTSRRD